MAACFVPPRGFAPVVGKGLCNAVAFISRRPHPDRTPKLKTNWQPLFRSTVKVEGKPVRIRFRSGPSSDLRRQAGRRGGGRTPALVADWVRTALSEMLDRG
jgi:hypothetical protein